jgi:thiol-disulfide isomerase/thioredoxin
MRMDKFIILSSLLLINLFTSTQAFGKVKVIEFFASWCSPCRAEVEINNRLHDLYGSRVEFSGINEDAAQDRSKADAFIASTHPNYPIQFDPSHDIARSMGATNKTPSTVIIDDHGNKEVINGSVTYDALKSKIDAHLR